MTTSSPVLLPPGGQQILVIIAHPDDAESFCGGTMARLAAEKCHVSQINPANHPNGYLRRWATEAGKEKGYTFAEAFHYHGL